MLGLARLAQAHRSGLAVANWQSTILGMSPYSFLRFKETSGSVAADISGNNRPGAYVNSPILMGDSLVPSDPAGRSFASASGPKGATIVCSAGKPEFSMVVCAKVGSSSFGYIPALANWNGSNAYYWMGPDGTPRLSSVDMEDARSSLLTDNKPHIHIIRISNTSGKSTLATDVSGGYGVVAPLNTAVASVGYNQGANDGLIGQFGETAVWDRYLSDDEVLKAILAWRGDTPNPLSVSARYWRMYCTANQRGDGYLNMASIAFRVTRDGYCHGAQPVIVTNQSSVSGGHDAHSCMKGDGLGYWASDSQSPPWWASVDFGRPVQVAEVAMIGANITGRQPKDFQIQSSKDGVNWVDRAVFTGVTGWNTVTERTFPIPAAPTYDMLVMEDAPVAYYKCDEVDGTVMTDSSGNGYHGTYVTSANLVRSGPLRAKAKGSIKMVGLGWAAIANNAALNVWGGAAWAMEFVAYPTGGGSVGQKMLGYNGTISSFGSFSTQWRSGKFQATGSGANIGSPNTTMNNRSHFILEKSGGVMTLYENGLPVATGPNGGGGSGDLYFMGSSAYPSSYALLGTASDFAIYNHALGPTRAFKHAEAADLQPIVLKAYRIYITANNGGTSWFTGVGELEFRAGGIVPLAHGTNPFASSTYSGYTPGAAFDGNKTATGSNDCWPSAAGSVAPQFVGCWVDSSLPIDSVAIWSRFLAAGQGPEHAPKDFKVQSSTDTTNGINGTWVDEWAVTGATGWGFGEGRVFTRP